VERVSYETFKYVSGDTKCHKGVFMKKSGILFVFLIGMLLAFGMISASCIADVVCPLNKNCVLMVQNCGEKSCAVYDAQRRTGFGDYNYSVRCDCY